MKRRVLGALMVVVAIAAVAIWLLGRDDDRAEAADATRPPIVLLIFDEFPADLLLGPDGGIDAGRYPAFAKLARRGYWFPNATTTYDSTTRAVPQILTGRLPRPAADPDYTGHPWSVYDIAGRKGYAIRRYEAATSVCPPRWCRGAARGRPAILAQLQNGRRERLRRFLDSIGPTGRPTLWVGHMLLPHGPYLFLPSGKQVRRHWRDPHPGMNSVPGFHSRHLTLHAQQRLQLQIGFLDRELSRWIDRLERDGTFDRALIVVTADHGISSEVGVPNRRVATRANIDEIAPVPLFVKLPGQRRGRAPRWHVRTIDVTPTIADVLGVRLPYRTDGRSVFSRAVRARDGAVILRRDFRGRLRISGRELERRRAALLRTRLRRFGHGDWDSLYTGIGPSRQLIGRLAIDQPRRSGGRLRARLIGAAALRTVGRDPLVRPTQIAGTIAGGAPGATRPIAVAVNGVIEATGETFHLRGPGRRGEGFAVMVPERALRRGANHVEVFEIVGGHALRPLGGTRE